MRTNLVLGFQKDDSKNVLAIAVVVGLMTCALILQGCSVVPQSSAAPVKSQARHATEMTLPTATVGTSYQTVLTGPGSSPTFSLTQGSLPAGLSLNSQTGSISGVPTTAGTYTFTVERSVNDNNAWTSSYTLAVESNAISIQVTPGDVSVVSGGTVQFQASVKNTSNTAVTWTAGAGSISTSGLWTAPVSTTSKSVTVTATSAANSTVQSSAIATITTNSTGALTIATSSLPSGTIATNYSASLTANGGLAPYQWSIVSGSLPSGIKLDSNTGAISGSASTAGTFSFNAQATDAASQTAQQTYSLLIANSTTACGPPTYPCSRKDMNVVQVTTVPNVGNLTGMNTIVTDPDFGNRISRITDANMDPHVNFVNRTFVTSSSGSADENMWNLDSTMLIVQDTGSRAYPLSFDPATMHASRMYAASYPGTNGLTISNSGSWSRVNPNILYVTSGSVIKQYDFTDRNTAPTTQTLYDYASSANCLPAGFTVTWQTRGGVSADDTVLAMGYSNNGNQGTGVYAVVYKAGSGCTVLNTQTGQVWGDWGQKGTINIPDRWLIHNVKLSKDGNWLVVATEGCLIATCSKGPYFWQIGTTNVSSCGAGGYCSGHWTEGYTHWINNNGSPIGNEEIRPFASPSSATSLTSVFPAGLGNAPFDQHPSWNNADPADSVPFASTTYTATTPFPSAWCNEIMAIATDGSGVAWRFAHSFITNQNQNFSTKYAIGSVSQDGKWFAFSSDWMGTLGSESGSASCTQGADCRGDVFVVEMR